MTTTIPNLITNVLDLTSVLAQYPNGQKIYISYNNCRQNKEGTEFVKENGIRGIFTSSLYDKNGELKVLPAIKQGDITIKIGDDVYNTKTTLTVHEFREQSNTLSQTYDIFDKYFVFSFGFLTPYGMVGLSCDRGSMC